MIEVLVVAHAAATLFMVGVIWFVQVVHYPLMARVSASEFAPTNASNRIEPLSW